MVPKTLWANSNTEIGRIESTEPIKLWIDMTKPFSKLHQYPLKPEAIQASQHSPKVEDLIVQGLIPPYTSPWNILILPGWKLNGRGWQFVQDLRAVNKRVILYFPVFANPTLFCYNI